MAPTTSSSFIIASEVKMALITSIVQLHLSIYSIIKRRFIRRRSFVNDEEPSSADLDLLIYLPVSRNFFCYTCLFMPRLP